MITAAELFDYLQILRPAWVTATSYNKGDYVTQSSVVYECLISHTSGTFATDLANLKWQSAHFVQQAVDQAIGIVNSYCNRDFRVQSYTAKFQGDGFHTYYPQNIPVTDVDTIKYFDESIASPEYVTIFTGSDAIANSVHITRDCIRLYNGYSFESGKYYEIVYNGGEVPEAIKQVCLEKAALYYKGSRSDELGKGSMNIGGQSDVGKSFNRAEVEERHNKIMDGFRLPNV